MGSLQLLQSPIVSLSSSLKTLSFPFANDQKKISFMVSIHCHNNCDYGERDRWRSVRSRRRRSGGVAFVSNKEDTEVGSASTATSSSSVSTSIAEERDGAEEASPQDPDYISQIKRVSKACKPRSNLYVFDYVCV